MIILYKKDETDFAYNGLGVLDSHISNQIVEESYNGLYALQFDYPIFALHGDELTEEKIVKAPTPDGDQLFRVYKVMPSMGIKTVTCYHIFYDLADNFIEDINIILMDGDIAVKKISAGTQYSHKFTMSSNITTVASARMVRKNAVQALLDDGEDNTFISRWGGEIRRNNFAVQMLDTRGVDNGVTIRHRKNLISYEAEIDLSGVVTRIMPYGFDGLMLPEKYVDSPLIGNYTHPKIRKIEYTDIKAAVGDYADDEDAVPLSEAYGLLRAAAKKEYSVFHIDVPAANYKVVLLNLRNTDEYAHFAELETIEPWDWVTVLHEEDGLEIKARMISYKYDPLAREYIEIELGSFGATLTANVQNAINTINKNVSETREALILVQRTADGKNSIYTSSIMPEDALQNDLWYKQTSDGTELWIYDNGEWVLLTSDATGEKVKAIAEAAQTEAGRAEEAANEAVTKANETLDEVLVINQTIGSLQNTVSGKADQSQVTQLSGQIISVVSDLGDLSSTTQSQITQLTSDINLRVQKNDIINQVNISTEGILIAGEKVHITGQTTIDNAVITAANIASIDASTITTGTLNAANVSVINLNASSIVGGTITGAVTATNFTMTGGRIIVDTNNTVYDVLRLNCSEWHHHFTPLEDCLWNDSSGKKLKLQAGGVYFNNSSDVNLSVLWDGGLSFKNASGVTLSTLQPSGLFLNDSSGNNLSELRTSGLRLKNSSGNTLSLFAADGVYFYNASGTRTAYFNSSGELSVNGYNLYLRSTGAKILSSANQQLYFAASGEQAYEVFYGVRESMWTFASKTSGYIALGSPNYKWGTVYSFTGAINTSDRNEKNTIEALDTDLWSKFITGLEPVTYKMNDGESGRKHAGLIAQDVESLMETLGIDSKDFAGFVKFEKARQVEAGTNEEGNSIYKEEKVLDADGNQVYAYALRYEEFIAPMIKVIQTLYKKVQRLEMSLGNEGK